jgi:hypothetical protein
LYFCVYVFHDSTYERKLKWVAAGGPAGRKEFPKAKEWIKNNTGIRSWGLKAIRMAFREKNPLDKNPTTNRGLTIVLLTDGGFTEAADYNGGPGAKKVLAAPLRNHVYGRTGSFDLMTKVLKKEQTLRVKKGLYPASIVTIGLENTMADIKYGTEVKRPDKECQAWLKQIGEDYGGGYFLVRQKRRKRKLRRVS